MPGTTNRYLGQDPILTNLALGYVNDTYVAEAMVPTTPVATQSGKPWVYDRSRFRPSTNGGKRAQGASSEEVRLSFSLGSPYFCEDHAKKIFVADEDVDNSRVTGRDPFEDATEQVTEIQLIDRETEAATLLTTTGNYASGNTQALSGTSRFDDYANSTPIETVRNGIQTVHSKLFVKPNKILIPQSVFTVLQDHPDFLERAKYTQLGIVTADLLARIWDVDQVVIAGAGYNTTNAGQTDSMSYIWGKNIILAYVNPAQSPKVLTFARNYQWKSPIIQRLRGVDEEDRRGTYVRRGDEYRDQEIASNEAGYLLTTVIS